MPCPSGAGALYLTGFYSESIGLAQMAEVPLVIVDVQRMGPATGGATTNAEGDVQFARWITSGGYPLVVYAPCDLASTWHLTFKAFDTAERLRTPVILLTSKNLVMPAESVWDSELKDGPVARRVRGEQPFLPYATTTADGVPPFLVFGDDLTRFTTSIHDERGLITDSPPETDAKLRRLAGKITSRAEALAEIHVEAGAPGAPAIVAYGSPARSARAARRLLRERDRDVTLVVLQTLMPLAEKRLRSLLAPAGPIVVPELNLGLLAPEIERLTPGHAVRRLTRIDGGAIAPDAIVAAVEAA